MMTYIYIGYRYLRSFPSGSSHSDKKGEKHQKMARKFKFASPGKHRGLIPMRQGDWAAVDAKSWNCLAFFFPVMWRSIGVYGLLLFKFRLGPRQLQSIHTNDFSTGCSVAACQGRTDRINNPLRSAPLDHELHDTMLFEDMKV